MSDAELSMRLGDLSRRLEELERKVDYMLKALNIDYQITTDEPPYMQQVRALVAAHKLIDAIKLYRENTGAGLADAKNFVEHL